MSWSQKITATNIAGKVCFDKPIAMELYRRYKLVPLLTVKTNEQTQVISYLKHQILNYTNIIDVDGRQYDNDMSAEKSRGNKKLFIGIGSGFLGGLISGIILIIKIKQ